MAKNGKLSEYLISFLLLIASVVLIALKYYHEAGWSLMLFFFALALTFRHDEKLKGFTFTTMIFAAASLAMFYPQYFIHWGTFKLSALIIPLLQVIMFGMGSELSVKELITVIKMPKAILVGIVCHYTIMPLIGFTLANV